MDNDLSSDFIYGDSNNVSLLSLLMADDETPTFPSSYDTNHNLSPLPPTTGFLPTPKTETETYGYIDEPYYYTHSLYSQLPGLLSLENHPNPAAEPPTPPPPPPAPSKEDSYSLESIVKDYYRSSEKKRKKPSSVATGKTLCQKAYCLGRLLPGANSRRRSTVELLEEVCKYVKFLQAQVSALQSMPAVAELRVGGGEGGDGRLWRLSRQQVLEVVVNSPAAQMVMAEKGWCIVAAEQVALMKKIEARKRLIHHLLANIPL